MGGKRYVWNRYHRAPRDLWVKDTTDSWTYSTLSTYRALNNATGNKVEYVAGDADAWVEAAAAVSALLASGDDGNVGVGIDSTTVNSARLFTEGYRVGDDTAVGLHAHYAGRPGLGYHALHALERTNAASVTFVGDDTGFSQSGLRAVVWG